MQVSAARERLRDVITEIVFGKQLQKK